MDQHIAIARTEIASRYYDFSENYTDSDESSDSDDNDSLADDTEAAEELSPNASLLIDPSLPGGNTTQKHPPPAHSASFTVPTPAPEAFSLFPVSSGHSTRASQPPLLSELGDSSTDVPKLASSGTSVLVQHLHQTAASPYDSTLAALFMRAGVLALLAVSGSHHEEEMQVSANEEPSQVRECDEIDAVCLSINSGIHSGISCEELQEARRGFQTKRVRKSATCKGDTLV